MRGRHVVALVLVVAALLWWWRRREVPVAAPPSHAEVAPAAPVAVPPALALNHGPVEAPPPSAVEPFVPATPPPIVLPPDTQALQAEFVPGTTEWEEVPMIEGSPLAIRFLPAKYNVIAPGPIVLYLEVVDTVKKKRVAIAGPRVRVRPFEHEDQWFDVVVTDDGRGADEAAGDLRYTATFVPTGAAQKALIGHVVAEGIIEDREAGVRRIPQALIYTLGPKAHLTGNWKDEAREGNLYLSAEVDVEVAGTFSLMAQLVGPAREPIALTRVMQPLETGKQWLTMRVWGKAIRDAGVAGPYEVRNVLLTRDKNERGDYDPGPTVISAHHTAAYSLAQFSDAPYVEPTVARGEEIGPDHPSQRNNPPPLYPASDRKTLQQGP